MRIDYLSKVGAAVTAFFAPPSFPHRVGGQALVKELYPVKTVAIIGAGAGGTSTAFFLNSFLQPPQSSRKLEHAITLFEQSDKIGGRCMAFKVKDLDKDGQKKENWVEVGASIFVTANHNLMDATEDFGLTKKKVDDEMLSIWDGHQFVFEESPWKVWNLWQGLKRWGLAPLKFRRVLKKTINDLLESYKSTEVFPTVAEFTHRFNLHSQASIYSHEFLKNNGIDRRFSEEVIEVTTRVNYGSNLNQIHALGALVSMAADDALQIQGGNFQIFEGMVKRSGAQVKLNTKVTRVKKLEPEYEGGEHRFEITTLDGRKEIFDTLVIAAPIQSMDIDFDLDLPPLPKVSYRTIHATFVRGHVNPAYFNAASTEKFPSHILTTNADAEFTSLSIQLKLSTGETVTKIFSPEPIQEELLDRLYTNRTWVKHKAWKAYPELKPLDLVSSTKSDYATQKDAFDNLGQNQQLVLEQQQRIAAWGKIEVVPGVFYLNSFEPLISTMETETIAGKNVARLVRDRILGYCQAEKITKRRS
ncbi:hypothetical protein BGZ83_002563 [Gryganskiella cystojenkinii]|nr:hypothetical protein BGZ83_002563 [Gryganskiella cystojenkinii]